MADEGKTYEQVVIELSTNFEEVQNKILPDIPLSLRKQVILHVHWKSLLLQWLRLFLIMCVVCFNLC